MTLFKMFGTSGCYCRLLGQFPVTAHQKGTFLLKYHPFSLAYLYALLCTLVPCVVFTYFRFTILKEMGYSVFLIVLRCWQVFYVLLTPVGWSHTCGLIRELNSFDRDVEKLPVISKFKKRNTPSFLYNLPPIVLLAWPILLELKYNHFHTKAFILKNISLSILSTTSVLFLCFTNAIIDRSRRLQVSCLQYIKLATKYNYNRHDLQLDQYQRLNLQLQDCVSLLNKGFAFKVAVVCADFFFNCLTDGYYASVPLLTLARLAEKIWYSLFVVLVGVAAIRLESVQHLVLDSIFDIPVTMLDPGLQEQMNLLVLRFSRSLVDLQCPGLIGFSKGFVGGFTLTLVTYFILVTQLAASN